MLVNLSLVPIPSPFFTALLLLSTQTEGGRPGNEAKLTSFPGLPLTLPILATIPNTGGQ